MRRQLSERDKQYLGTYCCNCGKTEGLNYHHIVPMALGGNDILTNLCCLCEGCHSMLHTGKKHTNISEATKAGIARARARGVQIGHRPGTKFTTRKSLEVKAALLKSSKDFDGNLCDSDMMNMCEVSRNSFYKYKRELKAEIDSGVDVKAKYLTENHCDVSTAYLSHHHLHNQFLGV